ncbi:MAG: SDR family NAD(P)-dependent oxidoreductase [Alphaproteobacteria bacterium]
MTQTVLITGATSGLGLEFSKLYANMGYRLILVARNQEKLEELSKNLNTETISYICNLTQKQEVTALCQQIIAQNHIPDILINNAGIGHIHPFDNCSFEDEHDLIAINISALVCLCNRLAFHMKSKPTPTYILNIASAAAFVSAPYQANYYASKAYVLSYSRSMAAELKNTSLSVSCFCPGRIATHFHEAAGGQYKGSALSAEDAVQMAHKAMINKKIVFIAPLKMQILLTIAKFLPSSWATLYASQKSKQLLNSKK